MNDRNVFNFLEKWKRRGCSTCVLIFSENLSLNQEKLLNSSNFLKHSVAMLKEPFPLEMTFTGKLSNPFDYYFKLVQSVFQMKKN